MLLLGPIGSALGICNAGMALHLLDKEMMLAGWTKGVALSMYTTVFACSLSAVGAILLGVVSHKMKQPD